MLKKLNISSLALVVVGVLSFLTLTHAQNNIINGCVNRQGVLRLLGFGGAAQCKSSETEVSWNTEGVRGPQGEKGDPGAPGQPGSLLHLYDSAGQDLGIISFGGLNSFITYVPELDTLLLFNSFLATTTWPSGFISSFFYEEENCTGSPFTSSAFSSGAPQSPEGQGLYSFGPPPEGPGEPARRPFFHQVPNTSPATRAALSRRTYVEGCVSLTKVIDGAVLVEQAPPLPFIEPLTPPLRVRQVDTPYVSSGKKISISPI